MRCDCVSEGRVNPDVFREVRRVKFLRKRMWRRRQKHGNLGTHPAALAAPSVNCCLETKQRSSLFSSLPFFLCGSKTYNFHYDLLLREALLRWIGLLILRYTAGIPTIVFWLWQTLEKWPDLKYWVWLANDKVMCACCRKEINKDKQKKEPKKSIRW